MNAVRSIWHHLFLEERPSIGLSFFRIFVALTTGLHVLPSFIPFADNYLSGAFKTVNPVFFPVFFIDFVQHSPDVIVVLMAGIFIISFLMFLFGIFSQFSCIVMTLGCYYFYALNDFHIGVLSWDILLVTLFLMCMTPYHGDYFSIDALRSRDLFAFRRKRPVFIQRLLQIQIASIFFYTALYKITAEGNWLTGNPIWTLVNYPVAGVTKNFMFKEFLATRPSLCYVIGIMVIVMELLLPFLLFIRRTRRSAIIIGFIFHILLLLTLDVPFIFFALFPAQLLLFVNSNQIINWIESKRRVNQQNIPVRIVYDGRCGFCRNSVQLLQIMDMWKVLTEVDFYQVDVKRLHPALTVESCQQQMYVIDRSGQLWGGFLAFRQLCWYLPMLYPLLLIVYLPGMAFIGNWAYQFIAKNRFLFSQGKACDVQSKRNT